MWDLFESLPVMMFHPLGGRRLCAAVFDAVGGVVMVEVEYPNASFHAIHFIEGKPEWAEERGEWDVGQATFSKVNKKDPEYEGWVAWMKSVQGTPYGTREYIRTMAENHWPIRLK
jgi:hypothetical protein